MTLNIDFILMLLYVLTIVSKDDHG
jgi:hypothetical protein